MPKPSTIADYADRIARVADYIGEHLDDPLDLERLAGIACFSPFHFHRIYTGLMGESVAETLRRQRLHRAAVDLMAREQPMLSVAVRAGYGSVAAFTRAFRAAYGVPPATYRGEAQARRQSVPNQETTMYQVTVREMPSLRVVAMPHQGDYQQIGATFERVMAWAAGRGLMGPDTRTLGIYYDDPDTANTSALRSDACVVVPEGFTPDDPAVRLLEVAGGRHACLLHVGPYANLTDAYRWLFGTWLPKSGEEAADRPCFEEYLNNPRELPSSEWKTDICVPLTGR